MCSRRGQRRAGSRVQKEGGLNQGQMRVGSSRHNERRLNHYGRGVGLLRGEVSRTAKGGVLPNELGGCGLV